MISSLANAKSSAFHVQTSSLQTNSNAPVLPRSLPWFPYRSTRAVPRNTVGSTSWWTIYAWTAIRYIKGWSECFKFQDHIQVSLKQHHQLINKSYAKNNIDYNSSYLAANIATCQCQACHYKCSISKASKWANPNEVHHLRKNEKHQNKSDTEDAQYQ